MLCAFIFLNVKRKFGLYIFIVGAIGLILSIFWNFDVSRLIMWGIPSFFIVLGILWVRQIQNNFFQYLGDASYSIYLIQVFSIPVFYKVSSKYFNYTNGNIAAIMCLMFSILCGCLFYKFVETRISNFLKKLNTKRHI
ncbi:hypothetical protein F960_01083 [Acinetobacter gerneri DSM 14967 = CIP 107464 = MTCC 9824]|uniref:Acyltransferase 3 domain-containing protein n=2 Tax=Acinetobacter gerneri TaxID=202952 RepID=N8ZTE9_9GAMM|nr:hypothetical protein F960_01083 [Acinetobacter gerneri DSM 14967 = CIP 107464 = MTCC 9824]